MRRIVIGVLAIAIIAIIIKIITFLVYKGKSKNSSNTLLLMEISRHGAREPYQLYDFTIGPNLNFNSTGQLLPLGKRQHFEVGQYLREKYVVKKNFLSANFSDNFIYVQSSDYNRTYLSALYQLMGMFPDDQPSVEDYQNYGINESYLSNIQRLGLNYKLTNSLNITKVNQQEDYFILTNRYNCPRYELVQTMTQSSLQYSIVLDYFAENLKPNIEAYIGRNVNNMKELYDICGYLYWAKLAELQLNFTLTKDEETLCNMYLDTQLYTISYGLDELWKLGAYQILSQIRNISYGLKTSQSFELVSTPFQSLKSTTSAPKDYPRFIHYAAHSETISLILEGLQFHDPVKYNPGAALFLEFYQQSSETLVKVFKYDPQTKTETILRHLGQIDDSWQAEEFSAMLTHIIKSSGFTDINARCQDFEFSAKENDYFTGQQLLDELTTRYQGTEDSMKVEIDQDESL